MAVYQDKAKERIKKNVAKVRSHCNKGKKIHMGEADTRAIVREVLIDCLGWDEFEDVTQEECIKGGYCDYLIRYEGKPYAVVEVKKVSGGLTQDHMRQAKHYAQDKGLDWIILTNGDEWEVYNLYYRKKRGENPEPLTFHLFTTSFTDTENVKPSERIEMLYLLSKEARRKDELAVYHGMLKALSPQELTKRIMQKDVIDRLRISIKNDIGYRIDNDELAFRIAEIIKDEAIPSNISYYIKRLSEPPKRN
ncbi:type I restriction enzyme HsdR N-terminal domain-containing protein [Eggerthella sp. YY7918]|uniref:type I restriction enzyme HsdR N-terminal domain-containing protein n=1 Tax=Eggerthella sp. (strain YY7918) TaxID=502558 RepID=UPI00021716D4|nr:type I restriction enzyme HsdR N-terminal domain-containing protein [Eggerthella sp. YY7918]BAK45571.1 predicted type IV restriction endonuclease [Eggerthella sp. YY7918]